MLCVLRQISNLVSASRVSHWLNFTFFAVSTEKEMKNETFELTPNVNHRPVQNKFVSVQLPIDEKPPASEESQLSLY